MDEIIKEPKVVISGGITQNGMIWAVFCYICERVVSESFAFEDDDAEAEAELETSLNIHEALHVRANDEI